MQAFQDCARTARAAPPAARNRVLLSRSLTVIVGYHGFMIFCKLPWFCKFSSHSALIQGMTVGHEEFVMKGWIIVSGMVLSQ